MKQRLVAVVGVLFISVLTQCSRPSLLGTRASPVVPVESTLVIKEKELWDANRRRDVRALSDLLAEDAYAVETDGSVLDKPRQLADLANLAISDVRMDSIRVLLPGPGVGIIRYRVLVTGAYNGTPMTAAWSEVSAVWALRDGKWRCVGYHATRTRN